MAGAEKSKFTLSQDGYRAVKVFLKYARDFDRVASAVDSETVHAGDAAFTANVSEKCGIADHGVRMILQFAANMREMAESREMTIEELVDGFTYSIQLNEGDALGKEEIDLWTSITESLKGFLSGLSEDSPMLISSKAQTLAYQHVNVVKGTRVITDLRPVFDSSGEQILEMVITHSLMVLTTEDEEVSFALDAIDLERLREQCERGQLKAKKIVESMKALPWPTVEFPESANE